MLDPNRIANNDTGQGGSRQYFNEWRVGPNISSKAHERRRGTNFYHVASDGTKVVFRCSTAGGLPIGGLTINKSDCGAAANTGLRVK
jgi:hypothetical protein